MARFDVHRDRRSTNYLLDCQSDLLSHLETRFMAPLLPAAAVVAIMPRLHPVFIIDGMPRVMATHLAAGVPLTRLGEIVQTLEAEDFTIMNALDMLLTGI